MQYPTAMAPGDTRNAHWYEGACCWLCWGARRGKTGISGAHYHFAPIYVRILHRSHGTSSHGLRLKHTPIHTMIATYDCTFSKDPTMLLCSI